MPQLSNRTPAHQTRSRFVGCPWWLYCLIQLLNFDLRLYCLIQLLNFELRLYCLIQLLNFELHGLWMGHNHAHLLNQLPSSSHFLQGVNSDVRSFCAAPHDVWISCSATSWRGETGSAPQEVLTSCSATSFHA